MMNTVPAFTIGVLLLMISLPATATEPEAGTGSTIATNAAGVLKVPAHSVRLTVGVAAKAPTATKAAAEVAGSMAAVLSALEDLGFDRKALPSAGYSVSTDEDWETGDLKGYSANSSVSIELSDPTRVGVIVDSVLAAGANEVSNIEFLPEDRRSARDKALELAFAHARRDAEALARAAGGTLGRLISVTTAGSGAGFEEIVVSSEPRGTYIPAPNVRIRASVQTKWELFLSGSLKGE